MTLKLAARYLTEFAAIALFTLAACLLGNSLLAGVAAVGADEIQIGGTVDGLQ